MSDTPVFWLPLVCVTALGCNALSGIGDLRINRDAGTCEHECEVGETRCTDDTELTCGSYDDDNCRDWGGAQSCGALGCGVLSCRPCEVKDGDECAVAPINCGCIAGTACQVDLTDGRSRCTTTGETEPFALCAVSADCLAGHACAQGVCRPHCAAEMSCAANAGECEPLATAPGIGLCTGHCDPMAPQLANAEFSGCGDGVYCEAGVATGQSSVDSISRCARASGAQGPFATCETSADCRAGLRCEGGRCTRWCRPDSDCGDAAYACDTAFTGYQIAPEQPIFACRALPCRPPPGDRCAVQPFNCGCETGQACQIDQLSGTAICEATGSVSARGLCSANTDCESGSTCVFVLPGGVGVCYPYCSPASPCPSNQGECAILRTDAPNIGVCTGHCDPVNPQRTDATFQACEAGVACGPPAAGLMPPYAICTGTEGSKGLGEACDDPPDRFDCLSGLSCATGVCTPWCRSDADCPEFFPRCLSVGGFTAGPEDRIGLCSAE